MLAFAAVGMFANTSLGPVAIWGSPILLGLGTTLYYVFTPTKKESEFNRIERMRRSRMEAAEDTANTNLAQLEKDVKLHDERLHVVTLPEDDNTVEELKAEVDALDQRLDRATDLQDKIDEVRLNLSLLRQQGTDMTALARRFGDGNGHSMFGSENTSQNQILEDMNEDATDGHRENDKDFRL